VLLLGAVKVDSAGGPVYFRPLPSQLQSHSAGAQVSTSRLSASARLMRGMMRLAPCSLPMCWPGVLLVPFCGLHLIALQPGRQVLNQSIAGLAAFFVGNYSAPRRFALPAAFNNHYTARARWCLLAHGRMARGHSTTPNTPAGFLCALHLPLNFGWYHSGISLGRRYFSAIP
jgi:hypothetical protein